MLTKEVEAVLNGQIEQEAYAVHSYLSMASWCETKGIKGASAFFYEQSAEERTHMLKLVKYVNEAGGHSKIPGIKEPQAKYKSLRDIFETSLAQEQAVTKSIYNLVEVSLAAKDFKTQAFLQWFVAEQHEEENLFQSALDLLNLSGDEEKNLLLVDNEIAKLRVAAATPTE